MSAPFGIPATVAADVLTVWDGRCFALLSTTELVGGVRLHHRCRSAVPSGSLFCTNFHKSNHNRSFGTVWLHRPSCAQCFKPGSDSSKEATRVPSLVPVCAPDPPRDVPSPGGVAASRQLAFPPAVANAPGRGLLSGGHRALGVLTALPPTSSSSSSSSSPGTGTSSSSRGRQRAAAAAPLASSAPASSPASLQSEAQGAGSLQDTGLMFEPRDAASREVTRRYIGPSGIRLRVRLACALQPANWCCEPPTFTSCLEAITGMTRPPSPASSDDELEGTFGARGRAAGRAMGRGHGAPARQGPFSGGAASVVEPHAAGAAAEGGEGVASASARGGEAPEDGGRVARSAGGSRAQHSVSWAASTSAGTQPPAAGGYGTAAASSGSVEGALLLAQGSMAEDAATAASEGGSLSSDAQPRPPASRKRSRSRQLGVGSSDAAADVSSSSAAAAAGTGELDADIDHGPPSEGESRHPEFMRPRGSLASSSQLDVGGSRSRSNSASAAAAAVELDAAVGAGDAKPPALRRPARSRLSSGGGSSTRSGAANPGPGVGESGDGECFTFSSDDEAAAGSGGDLPPTASSRSARSSTRSSRRGASGESFVSTRARLSRSSSPMDRSISVIGSSVMISGGGGSSVIDSIVIDVDIDCDGAVVGACAVPQRGSLHGSSTPRPYPDSSAAGSRDAAALGWPTAGSTHSATGSSHSSSLGTGGSAAAAHASLLMESKRAGSRKASFSSSSASSAAAGVPIAAAAAAAPIFSSSSASSSRYGGGRGDAVPRVGVHSSSAAAVAPSPPPSSSSSSAAQGAAATEEAVLQELHRAALSIDLHSAGPGRGDSWLTSTLIDAVAYEFARSYPAVHFLPTNVLAFELPTAARSKAGLGAAAGLRQYSCTDLLGRVVSVASDAISPVTDVPTSKALLDAAQEGAAAAGAGPSAAGASAAAAAASSGSGANAAALGGSGRGGRLPVGEAPPAGAAASSFAAPPGGLAPYGASQAGLQSAASRDSGAAAAAAGESPLFLPVLASSEPASAATSSAARGPGSSGGGASEEPHYDPYYVHSPPAGYVAPVYHSATRPLVMLWNIGNMHWNLIRVRTGGGYSSIEVFEPMGKPAGRAAAAAGASEGLSLRSVPRALIEWLDAVCPLAVEGGWRSRTFSAIKSKQQGNGFDCGVACLLYAEKCAQGREKEDIGLTTDQAEITWYRELINAYFESKLQAPDA